jgi:micrococcal nuclease
MTPRTILLALALLAMGCDAETTTTERAETRPATTTERERERAAPPEEPPAARASGPRDRVVRVTDGDTIVLAGLGRTRLIGVDTPEVYGGVECYGREASAYLKRLLPPGTRVRYRFDVERRDRYGRALAYVFKGGAFVNGEIARNGYGTPLTIPPNVRYADRFRALSREAREAGRGLWADSACAPEQQTTTSAPAAPAAPTADRDCGDFSTHAEAQAFFESQGGPESDPHRLDGDHDGRACELLP